MEEESQSQTTVQGLFGLKYEEWQTSGGYTWVPIMLQTDIRTSKGALFDTLRNSGCNIRRSYIEHGQEELHFVFVKGWMSKLLTILDWVPWFIRIFPLYILFFFFFVGVWDIIIQLWIVVTLLWVLFVVYFIVVVPVAREDFHRNQK